MAIQTPHPLHLSPLRSAPVRGHLETHLPAGQGVALRLEAPPPGFLSAQGPWDLRLLPGEGGTFLAVRGLAYVGEDPARREAFALPPKEDGFVTVAHIGSSDPEAVVQGIDGIMGWSAEAPTRPEPVAEPRGAGEYELVEEAVPERPGAGGGAQARWGVDMVEEACAGRIERPLHRDDEIDQLLDILAKKTKTGGIIVAPPGVGKSALSEGVAFRILDDLVPPALRGAKLIAVNLGMLTAGASHLNEGEGRWKGVLDEVRDRDDVILFIDEAHLLVDPRSNFAQMSKEDLARGRIKILGATTSREFKAIERDGALARRFDVVRIHELPPEKAVDIVQARRAGLEEHHGVAIPEDLVTSTVHNAKWIAPERVLPDLPLDILDRAGAYAARQGAPRLEERHIHHVIAAWKGVSEEQLGLVRPPRSFFDEMGAALNQEILGQERSLEAVVEALWQKSQMSRREARGGVRAAFLAAGPTGTGKTALAKALARGMFGKERVLRIDCAGLAERHHVDSLLGSPPGYVGWDAGGRLTNGLRELGFGVLLFDELEKAHPELAANVLLALLDEGYVVDRNSGEPVDASQFVVVATTNLGSSEESPLGFARGGEEWSPAGAREAVEAHFPPEVVARFDGILAFQPLSDEVHREIVRREVGALAAALADRCPPLGLEMTPDAEALVLEAEAPQVGRYGARAVKAAVGRRVTGKVLELVARHADTEGTVSVQAAEGRRMRYLFTPLHADAGVP